MITGAAAYAYIYMWIIIPGTTGIYNFLLMRNFFSSIPHDIIDSAKSDGAGHFMIFRRIVCLGISCDLTIQLIGEKDVSFPQFILKWNRIVKVWCGD